MQRSSHRRAGNISQRPYVRQIFLKNEPYSARWRGACCHPRNYRQRHSSVPQGLAQFHWLLSYRLRNLRKVELRCPRYRCLPPMSGYSSLERPSRTFIFRTYLVRKYRSPYCSPPSTQTRSVSSCPHVFICEIDSQPPSTFIHLMHGLRADLLASTAMHDRHAIDCALLLVTDSVKSPPPSTLP